MTKREKRKGMDIKRIQGRERERDKNEREREKREKVWI